MSVKLPPEIEAFLKAFSKRVELIKLDKGDWHRYMISFKVQDDGTITVADESIINLDEQNRELFKCDRYFKPPTDSIN